MSKSYIFFLSFTLLALLFGCQTNKKKETSNKQNITIEHPKWSKNASIYEVNIRNYTPSGTFKEFEKHLPRLKKMGVDILWFMPIHPIGEKNRKGNLGSGYSIKDYYAINPDMGTKEEFKSLVNKIHEMDMHVIIDIVINHTSWDSQLVKRHPEWFSTNNMGQLIPPVPDWTDVVDLKYENNPDLQKYMLDMMTYWVKETKIDGFGCALVAMVPTELWSTLREELNKIKPIFLLAEAETPEIHYHTFDMSYAFNFHYLMNDIAKGRRTAQDIVTFIEKETENYPKEAYRMLFTSNHEVNAWTGGAVERLGDGFTPFTVLTFTLPGMPLIYSGQETGIDKRLAFFEKDTIHWKKHAMEELYTKLLYLKKENKALWNGEYGGDIQLLTNTNGESILTFVRKKENNTVFVLTNLSNTEKSCVIKENIAGEYVNEITNATEILKAKKSFTLPPWGFLIYTQN